MKQHVIVTNHAILRYLERVGGFEIDLLRGQIADRIRPYAGLGATGVVIDGHVYVVDQRPEGSVVVTFIPKDRPTQALFGIRPSIWRGGR